MHSCAVIPFFGFIATAIVHKKFPWVFPFTSVFRKDLDTIYSKTGKETGRNKAFLMVLSDQHGV